MRPAAGANGTELLRMRVPLRVRSKKNSKARGRGHWKPFLSRESRALQEAISAYARRERLNAEAYSGPVAVELIAHFRTAVRPDTGNLSECVLDALEGIIYKNDRQVEPLLVVPCVCGTDALTIRVRTTEAQRGACVDE